MEESEQHTARVSAQDESSLTHELTSNIHSLLVKPARRRRRRGTGRFPLHTHSDRQQQQESDQNIKEENPKRMKNP